jgi:hypothetical protein
MIPLSAGLCLAANASSSFARPPLSFEPNVGQADAHVMFLVHSGGRAIYLTKSGLEISGVELLFRGGNCAAISGLQPLSERHNYFSGSSTRLEAVTDIQLTGGSVASIFIRGSMLNFMAIGAVWSTILSLRLMQIHPLSVWDGNMQNAFKSTGTAI